MPPKKKSSIPVGVKIPAEDITDEMKCRFCHRGKVFDACDGGEFFSLTTSKTHYYHYFCILFSSEGNQDESNNGIYGFLPEVLDSEFTRGQKLKCYICTKSGATVKCNYRKCTKKFHFTCGALREDQNKEDEHYFIFKDTKISAYCPLHIPYKQKRQDEKKGKYKDECGIGCDSESFSGIPGPDLGRIACTQTTCYGVFHRWCLQKHAIHSGREQFKCPLCRNLDEFQAEAERLGIYIPHADPSWEHDYNYGWGVIDSTAKSCFAKQCLCREGRQFNSNGTKYEIYPCDECGGMSVHIECGRLNRSNPEYLCDVCRKAESEVEEVEDENVEDKVGITAESEVEEVEDENVEDKVGITAESKVFEELFTDSESEDDDEIIEVLGRKEKTGSKKEEEILAALRDSDSEEDCQLVACVPTVTNPWGKRISIKIATDQTSSNSNDMLRWNNSPPRTGLSDKDSSTEDSPTTSHSQSSQLSVSCEKPRATESAIGSGFHPDNYLKLQQLLSEKSYNSANRTRVGRSDVEKESKTRRNAQESDLVQPVVEVVVLDDDASPHRASQTSSSKRLKLDGRSRIVKQATSKKIPQITLDSDEEEEKENSPSSSELQICDVRGCDELEAIALNQLIEGSSGKDENISKSNTEKVSMFFVPTNTSLNQLEPCDDDIQVLEIVGRELYPHSVPEPAVKSCRSKSNSKRPVSPEVIDL